MSVICSNVWGRRITSPILTSVPFFCVGQRKWVTYGCLAECLVDATNGFGVR